mgnify:CR=1 FL=1
MLNVSKAQKKIDRAFAAVLQNFDGQRDAVAAAQTQGGDTPLETPGLEGADQGGQDRQLSYGAALRCR